MEKAIILKYFLKIWNFPEAKPGPSQPDKMKSFETMVNGKKPLTIVAKLYIFQPFPPRKFQKVALK